ncbi:MAG: hypothetical protein ACK56F_24100, partial [bacterium]
MVGPLYQSGRDCRRRRRPGGPSGGQHSRRERSWSWQQRTRWADPRPRGGQRRSPGAGGNRRHWRCRRTDPVRPGSHRVRPLLLPLDLCGQGDEVCGPLHVGNLDRQGRLNAVVPGSLVHIVNQLSNRRFLVDTGASYSIFPHTSSAAPSGPKLRGAAGQLIPCWGEKTFDLSFQGRRFSWTFLLAAVSFPIIGIDFLRHFKLMVDPAANALVDKCSRESFATISSLTAATAADSGPPPAAQPAALILHRPPHLPASSVTGLLSHRPPQSPA